MESALPLRSKGKPSVPRSIPFNAVRTKPTVSPQSSTSAGATPTRQGRPRKDSAPESPQAAQKPQSEPKATNLDESCIGKRLSRRRGISKALCTELGTYGSYLRDLIVRITEIQKIAHKNLIRVKSRSKDEYDNKIRPFNVKIGDTVYAHKEIRDRKFDSRATGPYTVAGFTENNNVILETEDGERIMKHKDKLLLAHC